LAGDLIDLITGVVKFEVSDRPGRTTDRLAVHPANETQERSGGRVVPEDVVPLAVEGRAADLDQTGVVGPTVEAELPQPRRIQNSRRG
jgi:hypothetical protein